MSEIGVTECISYKLPPAHRHPLINCVAARCDANPRQVFTRWVQRFDRISAGMYKKETRISAHVQDNKHGIDNLERQNRKQGQERKIGCAERALPQQQHRKQGPLPVTRGEGPITCSSRWQGSSKSRYYMLCHNEPMSKGTLAILSKAAGFKCNAQPRQSAPLPMRCKQGHAVHKRHHSELVEKENNLQHSMLVEQKTREFSPTAALAAGIVHN